MKVGDLHYQNEASALLLVLWLTLALSLVVSVLAFSVNQQIQWVSWQRKKNQATILAQAALNYLPKILQDQRDQRARYGKAAGVELDFEKFTGEWKSPSYPLGDGKFFLVVRDAGQKLNVNTTPRAMWENFLQLTSFSEDDTRDWLDSLEDWIDADDAAKLNGAEDEYYGRLKPPYRAKNGPLSSLGEIPWIRKGPELLAAQLNPKLTGQVGRVVDFLTVDGDGKININTASAIVLASLGHVDITTAENWVRQRNGPDGLPGTEDDRPLEAALFQAEGEIQSFIITESTYFIVEGVGEVQGIQSVQRALFVREGDHLKKIKELANTVS